MMKILAAVVLGGFTLVAVTGTPALAGGTPAQKCASGKEKVAGKKAACLLGVQSKGETAPPVDGTKIQKCKDKQSAAYAKADLKGGCASTGDASAIESKVDMFVTDIVTDLAGGGTATADEHKCQGSKMKVAGKDTACLLGLKAKEKTGAIVDPSKFQKCKDKLSAAYAKAELKPCKTTGDAPTIQGKIDLHVTDVDGELPSTITCTSCCSNTLLSFTTGLGSGNCGQVNDDTGAKIIDLACGGLYFGGGTDSVPLPSKIPDMGTTFTKITSCNGSTGAFTFAPTVAGDIPAPFNAHPNRHCSNNTQANAEYPTRNGCLFGPPLPIPNSVTPGLSTCVINRVTTSAGGAGNCDGTTQLNLPLGSDIYLTGDLLTATNGIQPCPLCTGGTCKGGPNNGLACTAEDSAVAPEYPTSHDCPPPFNDQPCNGTITGGCLGTLPIAFNLTTGTQTKTSVDFSSSPAQGHVFCGYCSNGFGGFQGSATVAATPCTADSQCTTGTFTKCRQKSEGGFGTNLSPGAPARTIIENGAKPAACLSGTPQDSTLVSIFCIQPTFTAAVDSAADLPGPGSVALKGQASVQ
jgi:hypothetical protein